MFKVNKFRLAVCAMFLSQAGIVTNAMAQGDYGCPSDQEVQLAIDMGMHEKQHIIKIPTGFGMLQSEPIQLSPKLLEKVKLDHTTILYNSKSGSPGRIEVICSYRVAPGLNINFYKYNQHVLHLYIGATRFWTVPYNDKDPYAVCVNPDRKYCLFIDKPSGTH
jgi:hypothetical protein